jgi:hypothetical protein
VGGITSCCRRRVSEALVAAPWRSVSTREFGVGGLSPQLVYGVSAAGTHVETSSLDSPYAPLLGKSLEKKDPDAGLNDMGRLGSAVCKRSLALPGHTGILDETEAGGCLIETCKATSWLSMSLLREV